MWPPAHLNNLNSFVYIYHCFQETGGGGFCLNAVFFQEMNWLLTSEFVTKLHYLSLNYTNLDVFFL